MNGAKVDPEVYFNFTDITFRMSTIDRFSTGMFSWSHPVDLEFVKDHWDEMFDTYLKNATYRIHNTTMPLLEFKFTHLSKNNMDMNFTCKFTKPYFLGLL